MMIKHLPHVGPYDRIVYTNLHLIYVVQCFYASQYLGIVCVHSHYDLYNVRKVIDEDDKQYWSQDRPLGDPRSDIFVTRETSIHCYSLDSITQELF